MSRRRMAVLGGLVSLLVSAPSVAHAEAAPDRGRGNPPVPQLNWEACGATPEADAAGVECATATLPMDYDEPRGATVEIAVGRVPAADPAQRIGALFFNFGGPGGEAVAYLQEAGAGVFSLLNERFDIVGFDPRGVGQSVPAIDCQPGPEPAPEPAPVVLPTPATVDVETLLADAQAYADACLAASGEILEHLSTANVARDMDALRAALGEEQLNYLGFSYGTLLGATYAGLFPDRYRAMVLDGAINPERYLGDPVADADTFIAGFEDALDRFLAACAADQAACSGFGGQDPAAAYDALLAEVTATPLPVLGIPDDPTPVTADEIRLVTFQLLYAKQLWGLLAQALAAAEAGDGTVIREIFTFLSGDTGLSPDAFSAITAVDQEWPRDVGVYLDRAPKEYEAFPHFWWLGSYSTVFYAFWPVDDEDAYTGPFTVAPGAPPVLVIGTTHDPATPYEDAVALTEQLGNATLLTMEGDGHTAYGGNSSCIDSATDSYLVTVTLPAEGTVCPQEVPFAAPEAAPANPATATQRPLAVVTGR